jgi:hypothetical protein
MMWAMVKCAYGQAFYPICPQLPNPKTIEMVES